MAPRNGAQLPYSYEYVIEDPGTSPRPSLYRAPQLLAAAPSGAAGATSMARSSGAESIAAASPVSTSSHSSRCCSNGPSHTPKRPGPQPDRRHLRTRDLRPAQTGTELRGRIENELEANLDYGLLIRWYQHQFDPENYPDSDHNRGGDHRCDLGAPDPRESRRDTNPAPHRQISTTFRGVSATERRSRRSRAIPARYGKANWQIAHQPPATSTTGWLGWRHIRAKHGWSPADEAATRQTLIAPAHTTEQTATSMRYIGAGVRTATGRSVNGGSW